jgi:hypothetical protein
VKERLEERLFTALKRGVCSQFKNNSTVLNKEKAESETLV